MFTLLPPEEKKILATEYKRRFVVVSLCLVCGSLVMAAILFLPSYVLSKVQVKESELRKNVLTNSALVSEEGKLTASIKSARSEITIAKVSGHFPSQIFLKISGYRIPGITLNHFTYSYQDKGSTITLTGNASDRQTLINFNNALKADPLFANADFPLSNLSASKNINFTLNITGPF